MIKELRVNKDGTRYYSFLYLDKGLGRRVRMSREAIRQRFGGDIVSEEEATRAAKLLDAEFESLKMRLQKRCAWEQEFYNFSAILNAYTKKQKKRAPNSFQNNVHYLKYYVLHFFLTVNRCNNIEFWPELYEPFKEWLETKAYLVKQPEKLISYGAKNHCIKSLNTFMRQLYQDKIIQRLMLCEKFPSHKLNERSIDDVISEQEMERVYEGLKRAGYAKEAVFYRLLYFTGMRSNEGLGISLSDLHKGEIKHESLHGLLSNHGISYRGYLVLASQPDHQTKALRSADGRIKRKPLKGRKKISEKYTRVIPIVDQCLWIELVNLYNGQVDEMTRETWGKNPSDYALFDGLDRTTATRKLHEVYERLSLRYRSWHCCRHSCATNIIGNTGDYTLARLWLGHSSPNVIERYVHVHQAIVRLAAKQEGGGGRSFKKFDPDD